MNSLPQLPKRQPDSHKGTYGRALLIGGSRGMAGSIALSGMAALRAGAGLVRLAVPDGVLDTVAAFDPCYMTEELFENETCWGQIGIIAKDKIATLIESTTCVAYGPGVGRGDELNQLVAWLYETVTQPLVIDADGLNGLANRKAGLSNPGGPRILTPHPGEFQRLVGREKLPRDEAEDLAAQLAADHNIVIVLKGHHTLVTDGQRRYQNQTGNPGMATGGSGDVLTGIITALVCQGLEPFEAAQLGVYVHGMAGDMAADELGQVGMIASDWVRFLPLALRSLES